MRIFLDSCVLTSAKAVFLTEGHDVEHVGDWPADPAILAHAADRGAVVVTLDKDFGELAAELLEGSIITVEQIRTRVRPPDLKSRE